MCDIDDGERSEVWVEHHRRARKRHVCDGCGGVIMPGTRYLVHFSVYEGSPSSAKACSACEAACNAFGKDHHLYPHPGSITETLEQCIDEGDEESMRKWQPLLDGIRARRGVELTS